MQTEPETVDFEAPVRLVSISFPKLNDAQILKAIENFAGRNKFALRITGVPGRLSDEYLELFRTDIRMTGALSADRHTLDIAVYRSYKWNVEKAAFDQGVNALRAAMQAAGELEFNQTILKSGDTARNTKGYGGSGGASFIIPEGQLERVRLEISNFAQENGFAIRFFHRTPNPDELSVILYRSGIQIALDAGFSEGEIQISDCPLTGQDVPLDVILGLYKDLKLRLEKIENLVVKLKSKD